MNYLITITAVTALALSEWFVEWAAPAALIVVVGCGAILVALIVRQSRLERRWADEDRRRADLRFARQHPTRRPR
jgi:hypothetical protein